MMFDIVIAKLSIYLHMTKKTRDVFHNQTFIYGRCNKSLSKGEKLHFSPTCTVRMSRENSTFA